MFDAVVDTQPVISRLARSKDSLLSSFFQSPNLSSKISLLGHIKSLGFSPYHQRANSDLEVTAPSFHDYLILSGGGLEPAFRLSLSTKARSSRRNSSFLRNYNSATKELRLSETSTGDFSGKKADLVLKESSGSVPILTPPQSPTPESCEASNSTSSVLSVIVSPLTASKTPHERHVDLSGEQTPNTDEFNQLGVVSIMRLPSKMKSSALFGGMGDRVNGNPHSSVSASGRQFSPPSFIRPNGRKLIARREPSPLAYMPSMESLRQDDSVHSSATNGSDEGVSLSRMLVRRDTIPEVDEGQYNQMAHHDLEGHHYSEDHHHQITCCDQVIKSNHIPDHNQTPELECTKVEVSTLVPQQEEKNSEEDITSEKITQQIDSIVEKAALDDRSKSEWRTYMENYSKVGIGSLYLVHCLLDVSLSKTPANHSRGASTFLPRLRHHSSRQICGTYLLFSLTQKLRELLYSIPTAFRGTK